MENKSEHKESAFYTWTIIILMLIGIITKGFFSFAVVGDLGQPNWDYRPIKDVPSESPYAIYEKLPYIQHVKGMQGE